MSLRLPSLKTTAALLLGLAIALLLFLWLALPPILKSQAESLIAEKSGHHLSLGKVNFNPLDLSLRIAELRLTTPEDQPLLAFRELLVDLSAASLTRRAYVFDAIRLDGLEATAERQADGRLNWSPLIDALKDKEAKPDTPLPAFDIGSLVIAGGRIDLADRQSGLSTRIEPLDLELSDISSLPDDKGRYRLAARSSLGARLLWQGEASLVPLAFTGSISVEELDLARLAPVLQDKLPIAVPSGVAALVTRYRAGIANGKLDLQLEQMAATISGLGLGPASAGGPAIRIDTITAEEGKVDLAERRIVLGAIKITGGRLRATRDAQGRIDLLAALPAAAAKPTAAPPAAALPSAAPAWRYRLGKLDLTGLVAELRDEGVSPPAELRLEDITLAVEGISDDLKVALPIHAALRVHQGGQIEAEGQVIPKEATADFRLKLSDLALAPIQPYLASAVNLKLSGGSLSVEGRASRDAKASGFRGGFALKNLRLTESGSDKLFLAWKSLASRDLELTPAALAIGDLALEGLDTQLIIEADKSVNLKRILKARDAEVTPSPPAAEKTAAKPFRVDIDRLRFKNAELDFADHSLALPFGTRIHSLNGLIAGLSTRPARPAQVELDGQVDDYGLARAVGEVDLADPTNFMDLKVVFRNVEMTRLTPYSATFAGRRIASGKLSLDLEYRLKQRELLGENQVIMDQLVLGERIESPTAKDLPLDLAIALLQDADGRIDLGLPVSGSLDDPQFSYGQIVWKAIVNVLTKIVTAPFRALFGGGEKFEAIAFEAGEASLTPPEREKVQRLAAALGKRPGLALGIAGTYADTDRLALQDLQLRRTLAARSGQRVEGDADPGPISPRQPKIQAALETLFADRLGSGELAALKEGFRRANPGELPESTTGKMMSRLSGMFREKRALSEQEVAALKGTDFHGELYERLRAREAVGDDRLLALAKARGEALAAALKAAGAPMARISLQAPEKAEASGREIAVKLELGAAAPAAAPASN